MQCVSSAALRPYAACSRQQQAAAHSPSTLTAAARRHQLPAAGAACQPERRQRRVVSVGAGFGFGKPQEKKLSKQKACPCGSGLEYKVRRAGLAGSRAMHVLRQSALARLPQQRLPTVALLPAPAPAHRSAAGGTTRARCPTRRSS